MFSSFSKQSILSALSNDSGPINSFKTTISLDKSGVLLFFLIAIILTAGLIGFMFLISPKDERKTDKTERSRKDELQKDTPPKELTCLLCKKPSNGKHFCRECYERYKEREIEVHITNCINCTITDKYGNKKILCKNGMKVRSRAEKIVADFLFDHNIRFVYEIEIPYEYNYETKALNPDFFLPDYGTLDQNGHRKGLIIEYNELKTPEYLKQKKFSADFYEKSNFEVLTIGPEDIENNLHRLKMYFNVY